MSRTTLLMWVRRLLLKVCRERRSAALSAEWWDRAYKLKVIYKVRRCQEAQGKKTKDSQIRCCQIIFFNVMFKSKATKISGTENVLGINFLTFCNKVKKCNSQKCLTGSVVNALCNYLLVWYGRCFGFGC